MIKFRLVSEGISPNDRRRWLPKKARSLPALFTFDQVPAGAFSKSVMKRLRSAKKDGAYIHLRGGRRYSLGIVVINKEQRAQKKSADRSSLQKASRRLKALSKDETVKEFLSSLLSVVKLSKNTDLITEETRGICVAVSDWYERYWRSR